MMVCVYTVEKCQNAGENRPYGFDWTVFLANRWRANSPFALDARVRPSTELLHTGFEYNSSGGQTSGKKEPTWPKVLNATVIDGSIRWTAVAMSEDGLLETIVSSTWDVPAEVTDTTDTFVDEPGRQATSIFLASATPGVYTITNEIVTSTGAEYQAVIELTIE
jgi:hypothetical protein